MEERDTRAPVKKYKRDFRTGSPHRVFRATQDVTEDLGYDTEVSEPLELKPSPITDTATFRAEVLGDKPMPTRYNWNQGIPGILCIVVSIILFSNASTTTTVIGIILIAIGIALLATAIRRRKQLLIIEMEGEAYKAASRPVEWAQTIDMVADVRITVTAMVTSLKDESQIVKDITKPEMEILQHDFTELQTRIENILPSFMVR
jgi:hypothetical protein